MMWGEKEDVIEVMEKQRQKGCEKAEMR